MENKNHELIEQMFAGQEVEDCQRCKTVYQLTLIKPGKDYNDFGIRFCPYCSDSTEGLINYNFKNQRELKDNGKRTNKRKTK